MNFTIYATPDPNVFYFEHDYYGENHAGRMWFKNKELIDYDGVFELPIKVISQMITRGFDMSYATEVDDE